LPHGIETEASSAEEQLARDKLLTTKKSGNPGCHNLGFFDLIFSEA
jgi:hypothetical protein